MQIVSLLVLVAGLSTVLERIIELLIKPVVQLTIVDEAWGSIVLKFTSVAVSLAAAWGFNLDVFTPVFESYGVHPNVSWLGLVLTGVITGLGSNVVHEILSWMTVDIGRDGESVLTSGVDRIL